MKYIILLISLSFTQVPSITHAFGQETTISETPNLYGQVPFTARTATIGFMLRYVEECYNDSTETALSIHRGYNFDWLGLDSLGYKHLKEYEHETPTLKGFTEWLKKK